MQVSAHPHAAGKAAQSESVAATPESASGVRARPQSSPLTESQWHFEPPPCLAPRPRLQCGCDSLSRAGEFEAGSALGGGQVRHVANSAHPEFVTNCFHEAGLCCEASSSYGKTRSVRTICRREPASRVSGWPNIGSVSAVTTRICVNLQVRVVRMAPGLAHSALTCARTAPSSADRNLSPSKSTVDTVSTASMTSWSITYSTHHWQVT